MRRFYSIIWMALLLMGAVWTAPAEAQLLTVTGDYRITDVDKANQRVGIAIREDDPNRRQNWLYIRPDTHINVRRQVGRGAFRDEQVSWEGAWSVLKKGRKIRIHGGRDWDGTIVAKKIWM